MSGVLVGWLVKKQSERTTRKGQEEEEGKRSLNGEHVPWFMDARQSAEKNSFVHQSTT